MKFFLGVLCCFFSVQVAAEIPAHVMEKLRVDFARRGISKLGNLPPNSDEVVKPIRKAKLRVKVYKAEFKKDVNGNFGFTTSTVCQSEAAINVYDFRSLKGPIDLQGDMDRVQCPTVVEGVPQQIHVGSFVYFGSEGAFGKFEDIKASSAQLWFNSNLPSLTRLSAYAGSASFDLSVRSLAGVVMPNIAWSCTSDSDGNSDCTPEVPEYFYAVIDAMD